MLTRGPGVAADADWERGKVGQATEVAADAVEVDDIPLTHGMADFIGSIMATTLPAFQM
jgi:hypothetical protein